LKRDNGRHFRNSGVFFLFLESVIKSVRTISLFPVEIGPRYTAIGWSSRCRLAGGRNVLA
jgi:hypothetical protein